MSPEHDHLGKFPTRLLVSTLVLTFATFWWVVWTTSVNQRNVAFQSNDTRLEKLNGVVMRLDEVLTASARMAAVTGESRWEERYRQYEPDLDAAIKETMALASDASVGAASTRTDAANTELVAMENRAFAFVRNGRRQEALALLSSPGYEEQKAIYAGGMNAVVANLRTRNDTIDQRARAQATLLIAGSTVLFGLSMGAWITVIGSLRRTQRGLAHEVEERTAELRDTAEYLQNLIDHANAPIVVWNPAFEITRFNHAFERLTGRSSGEVLGKGLGNLFPDDSREQSMAHVRRTATGERWETVELPVQQLDGSVRTVLWNSATLFEADGRTPIATIAQGQDITERRRVADALGKSEQRLHLVLEGSLEGFWDHDVHTNVLVSSPHCADLLAVSPEERPSTIEGLVALVHPDDVAIFRSAAADHFEGRTRAIDVEFRVRVHGDSEKWLQARGKVVERDADGHPVRVAGTLSDITERKQGQDELARLSRQNELILSSAAEGILGLDLQGNHTFVNPAAATMLGYRVEQLLGRPGHSTWHYAKPDGSPYPVEDCPISAFRDGVVRHASTDVFWREDGTSFPVEYASTPIHEQGRLVGAVIVFADVTERQKAQLELVEARDAALEATRLKAEFLANMSHEIRTPMNGVIGMTELVLDTDLTLQQREYLDMAKASADTLLRIVNDILDFSKIEAGRLTLDPAEFRLRDTLDDTLKPLALRANKKGLELFCDVQGDVPDTLVADAGRLRQVLVNLLGNAIKFTRAGEVLVTVWAEPQDAPDAHNALLHVAVSDTGIGIPMDKQAMIFDAFSQADGSITRTFGGTGLGLTISSSLVQMMGGRIWVESTTGQGTTFHFTVPVRVQDTQAPAEAVPPALVGLSVLVVDDNATNRRILEKTLEKWQMRPTLVDSGEAALAAVREAHDRGTPFPLVLLDVTMPEMDGFTVVKRLNDDNRLARPAIVMLTSAGEAGDAARCRELGVAEYLIKPVRQAALREAVLVALGRPSSGHEVATSPPALRHGPSLRILLAEDNVVNQRVAIGVLEGAGHAVTLAANGREALAALEASAFDLVLMDEQMPEMSGSDATAAIRERERVRGGHLPIIALTAHALAGDRERCLAAGADGYVAKPIARADLFREMDIVTSHGEARPSPLNPTAVFDEGSLLARVGGSQALLQEVIGLFLEDCPRLLDAIRRGLADGDAAVVYRTAHTLKGSAGNFGGDAVVAVIQRLEASARQGDLSACGPVFAVLETTIGRLTSELTAVRKVA